MKTTNSKNFSLLFAGSGTFALPIFEYLANNYHCLILVTKPEKPKGRGCSLYQSDLSHFAKKKNIKHFQTKTKDDFVKLLTQLKPDLVIIASFGLIVPSSAFDLPKFGFINIHPSLLPKYRGTTPIASTILNGDKKTGVSFIRLSEEIDSGDILFQKQLKISAKEDYAKLEEKLVVNTLKYLDQVIEGVITKKIKGSPQNHQEDYCQKVTKVNGLINWQKESAVEIERKIRAYYPWPGTYTYWNKKILKILSGEARRVKSAFPAGTFFIMGGRSYVSTNNGSLKIKKVQLESKKPMEIEAFLLGNHLTSGTILG